MFACCAKDGGETVVEDVETDVKQLNVHSTSRGFFSAFTSGGSEPNPPTWPASVHVIEADDKFVGNKQALFDRIFTDDGKYSTHPWGTANTDGYGGFFNETGRDFCEKRTTVLLKPGKHSAKFNVGFYNSLIGLGVTPDEVQVDGFECLNGVGPDGVEHSLDPGALNQFWRSVENLQTPAGRNMYYFISQASPIRKVHVQGSLRHAGAVGGGIWDWGYASGGFAADCKAEGGVEFGGQQQFLTRNLECGQPARHGAWSIVSIGLSGEYTAVPGQLARYTEVASTERIAEKPFVAFENGRYFLMVPGVETGKRGTNWGRYKDERLTKKIDLSEVYVAVPGACSASTINQKLAEGKSVVFSPGIYGIEEPIVVCRDDTVLLGLGMATIRPSEGAGYMDSLVLVKDGLQGIRISSLLLQAGEAGTDALLKWGTRKDAVALNTGFLHDIFCRVGGDRDASKPEVRTDCMIQINTSNVVGENLWLWRADHELPRNDGVKNSRNKVRNALQVNGDGVIMYGLFAEHALENQVVWNGEKGKTIFFQCELPYDVTQQNFGDKGFAGYVIGQHVKEHSLQGAGVYCYFRDYAVHAACGFRAPQGSGIHLKNIFTVFLNGKGGINHVLNDQGKDVSSAASGQPNFLQ